MTEENDRHPELLRAKVSILQKLKVPFGELEKFLKVFDALWLTQFRAGHRCPPAHEYHTQSAKGVPWHLSELWCRWALREKLTEPIVGSRAAADLVGVSHTTINARVRQQAPQEQPGRLGKVGTIWWPSAAACRAWWDRGSGFPVGNCPWSPTDSSS